MNFFDDIGTWMGDFFRNYFSGVENIMRLAEASPTGIIEGFPSVGNTNVMWETATQISNTIGVGVASTIISLFLFFELASIFNRSDTKGWDGIYWILMAFLKVLVAITIAKHMTLIIGMCFEITSKIVTDLRNSSLLNVVQINNTDALADQITQYYMESGDFLDQLSGYMLTLVAMLVNGFCKVIVEIMCKLRFIEIFVFTAVAPLPFCTFCNQEYKSIGISFLKRLIALGLQGVFIAIICTFYVQIVNTSLNEMVNAGLNVSGTICTMMGYSILLVIGVFQTGGWSKSLLQVN